MVFGLWQTEMYNNQVHYNVNDELKSADSPIAKHSAVSLTRLLATGFDFHKSGALDSALSCYHEILLLDEKNFDALQLIGAAHLAKDEYLEAADFFGKALRLSSSDPAVLVNMASALKGLGDPEEAIVLLERPLLWIRKILMPTTIRAISIALIMISQKH